MTLGTFVTYDNLCNLQKVFNSVNGDCYSKQYMFSNVFKISSSDS